MSCVRQGTRVQRLCVLRLVSMINHLRPNQVRTVTETSEVKNHVKVILALHENLGHIECIGEEVAVKD